MKTLLAAIPLHHQIHKILILKLKKMETYSSTNTKLESAKKHVKRIKGFYIHAIVYICVNLMIIVSNSLVAKNGFADADGYMTALFWGFGLLAHGLAVFAPDFIMGRNWEERKIQEYLNK